MPSPLPFCTGFSTEEWYLHGGRGYLVVHAIHEVPWLWRDVRHGMLRAPKVDRDQRGRVEWACSEAPVRHVAPPDPAPLLDEAWHQAQQGRALRVSPSRGVLDDTRERHIPVAARQGRAHEVGQILLREQPHQRHGQSGAAPATHCEAAKLPANPAREHRLGRVLDGEPLPIPRDDDKAVVVKECEPTEPRTRVVLGKGLHCHSPLELRRQVGRTSPIGIQ
mmetsp:Transcript_48726/g.161428  ORF Transcript_48726/g.161428 Transcript_48726/m.161428 type:complete len:221 (-) Transcript_48726:448-1110(-)